jgi:hypothetical protein
LDYTTWKCHKETSCVAILNNHKCHFFLLFLYKISEKDDATGPVWGCWYQWEWGGGLETVKDGEYSKNAVYMWL